MGTWGTFDDENDEALDIVDNIIEKCLPVEINKLSDKDYEKYNKQQREFLLKNKKKVYKEIMKWIGNYSSKNSSDYVLRFVVSPLVYFARYFQENEPIPTIYIIMGLPEKLPDDFPNILQKIAIMVLKYELKNVDLNEEGWDIEERKNALLGE